jgi:hypothetical protein
MSQGWETCPLSLHREAFKKITSYCKVHQCTLLYFLTFVLFLLLAFDLIYYSLLLKCFLWLPECYSFLLLLLLHWPLLFHLCQFLFTSPTTKHRHNPELGPQIYLFSSIIIFSISFISLRLMA